MAYITCKDLVLGYDGRIVSKGINFSVGIGDYLCIVGENGAGKSTLMKTVLKLNQPMEGSVEYGDGLSRKELGYLPQQTVVQKDFPASVYEIVLSGNLGPQGQVLQGSFRRTAAARPAFPGIGRYREAAFAGRTCKRTGSEGDGGNVSADQGS